MAHQVMFGDDDPGLAQLRRIALGFPEAFEKISWGRPVFCAPKMFAMFGASSKPAGERVHHRSALLIRVDDNDRPALQGDDRFFVPMYMGAHGWLGLDIDPTAAPVDWDEVTELLDASYRLVAPTRLVRRLDDQQALPPQ